MTTSLGKTVLITFCMAALLTIPSGCKKRKYNLQRNFSGCQLEMTDYSATIYYPNDSVVTVNNGIEFYTITFDEYAYYADGVFEINSESHYTNPTIFYYLSRRDFDSGNKDTIANYKPVQFYSIVGLPTDQSYKEQNYFVFEVRFQLNKLFGKKDDNFTAKTTRYDFIIPFDGYYKAKPDSVIEHYTFRKVVK